MKAFSNLFMFLLVTVFHAQDWTENYRKLILNSPNNVSLFQSNSANGIWASGMINGDRWGVFEDATITKEWFTILSGGNVGIGTSAPGAKLHVHGSNVGSGNVLSSIMLGKTNGPEIQTIQESADDDVQGLAFRVKSSAAFVNPSFEAMRINKDGRVGIGISNPAEPLDVNGNIRANRMVKIDGHGSVASLQIMDNSDTGALDVLLRGDAGVSYIKSGNVGIGTTTPDAKLTVKGQIHTQEVKVDLNGAVAPDFVFKEDYALKSLKEVQGYINEHGHLPNIPSATEMEENGFLLKEMNLKLLEKIEELTLYTLQQQKELENQKKKNQELEERLLKLENKLNTHEKKTYN